MTSDRDARDEHQPATPGRRASRTLILAVAVAGLLAVAVALAFGSPITQIAVVLIALTALQGTILGATETAGLVAALALAALIAFPLGRAIEDPVGNIANLHGVAKRAAGIAAAASLALIVGSLLFGAISRRLFRKGRRGLADRSIGGALGFVEGLFLAILALWGLFALEPVAQSRVASGQAAVTDRQGRATPDAATDPEHSSPTGNAHSSTLARRVLAITGSASGSFIGRLARDTNPFAEAPVIAMADDYLVVVRDPDAMAHFLESDAVRRFNQTPSVRLAIEIIRNDPEVRAALERGLDGPGLRAILESDTVLQALDDTNVIADIEPLVDDLRAALEEAKAKARAR
jgi:hypothetical protein